MSDHSVLAEWAAICGQHRRQFVPGGRCSRAFTRGRDAERLIFYDEAGGGQPPKIPTQKVPVGTSAPTMPTGWCSQSLRESGESGSTVSTTDDRGGVAGRLHGALAGRRWLGVVPRMLTRQRSASLSRDFGESHPTYKIATASTTYSTTKIVYSGRSASVRPNRSQPTSSETTAATNGWVVVGRTEISSENLMASVSRR
jgi:hypothetical protein